MTNDDSMSRCTLNFAAVQLIYLGDSFRWWIMQKFANIVDDSGGRKRAPPLTNDRTPYSTR